MKPEPQPNKKPAVKSVVRRSMASEHLEEGRRSLIRLARTPFSTFMNCLVIGIALALPAFLVSLLSDVQEVISQLDKDPKITLYLETNIDETAALKMLGQIRKRANIQKASLVTPDQALKSLEAFMPGAHQAVDLLGENPLPSTIIVTPAKTLTTAESIQQLQTQLAEIKGVNSSEIDIAWVKRLFAFSELINHMVILLGLLLSVAVLLVIGNTIRLLIDARSEEIAVIKLVGGTDAFIRRPLLYSGLWIGTGGGIVALVLTGMATWWLNQPVQGIAVLYASEFDISGLNLSSGLVLVLFSACLGWLGARLAINQQLHQIEP